MTNKNLIKQSLALTAGLLLLTASSQAVTYHVDINTAALALSANGPFSLDLQLNSGSTLNNNSAVISNLNFGTGGAPFGAVNAFGGVSGSLPGSITLHDTTAFNEFFQSFTAGSDLSFDVWLTQAIDAGTTPDAFAIAILDGTTANIPTTGFADQFFSANIDSTGPLTVTLGSGTGEYAAVTATASVPDTGSTLLLLGLPLLGLVAFRRKATA